MRRCFLLKKLHKLFSLFLLGAFRCSVFSSCEGMESRAIIKPMAAFKWSILVNFRV